MKKLIDLLLSGKIDGVSEQGLSAEARAHCRAFVCCGVMRELKCPKGSSGYTVYFTTPKGLKIASDYIQHNIGEGLP